MKFGVSVCVIHFHSIRKLRGHRGPKNMQTWETFSVCLEFHFNSVHKSLEIKEKRCWIFPSTIIRSRFEIVTFRASWFWFFRNFKEAGSGFVCLI